MRKKKIYTSVSDLPIGHLDPGASFRGIFEAVMLIRIRIQRYKITDKMRRKAEFNQQKYFFFRRKLYFSCLNLKKVGADRPPPHSTHTYFFTFKNEKMFRKFSDFIDLDPTWIRPGSGSGLITFCESGSGYDQSGFTSLIWGPGILSKLDK